MMRTLLAAAVMAILMVSCSPDEPGEPGYLGINFGHQSIATVWPDGSA
jgi:hypothetical protein